MDYFHFDIRGIRTLQINSKSHFKLQNSKFLDSILIINISKEISAKFKFLDSDRSDFDLHSIYY